MNESLTIAVTSDLHMGMGKDDRVEALAEKLSLEAKIDAVILCGDLTSSPKKIPEQFARAIRPFRQICDEVLVVAGNHDLYGSVSHKHGLRTSSDFLNKILPQVCEEEGAHWLEGSPKRLGNIGIAGTIAWYDYSARFSSFPYDARWYQEHKSEYNLDGIYVDGTLGSDGKFAERCKERLVADLTAFENDSRVEKVIVATHVPLFRHQVPQKPGDRSWNIGTAYFGNLTMGWKAQEFPKVRLCVAGHTHRGADGVVNDQLRSTTVPADYRRPCALLFETGGDLRTVPMELIRP